MHLRHEIHVGSETVPTSVLTSVVVALETAVQNRYAARLAAARADDLTACVVESKPLDHGLRVDGVDDVERRSGVAWRRQDVGGRSRPNPEGTLDGGATVGVCGIPEGTCKLDDLLERDTRRVFWSDNRRPSMRPLRRVARPLLLQRPARRQNPLGIEELLVDRDLGGVEEVRQARQEARERVFRNVVGRDGVERDVNLPTVARV